MFLSTANDPQNLYTLGVPGLAFVIIVLAGVIIYLYKTGQTALDKKQAQIDAIQEQRIVDAKETRDKLMEPLEKQTQLSEKIYDIVLHNSKRR
jgi:hypothetical protein